MVVCMKPKTKKQKWCPLPFRPEAAKVVREFAERSKLPINVVLSALVTQIDKIDWNAICRDQTAA